MNIKKSEMIETVIEPDHSKNKLLNEELSEEDYNYYLRIFILAGGKIEELKHGFYLERRKYMIYQLTYYIGAIVKDKVCYSAEVNFVDCTKLFIEPFDITPFIKNLREQVKQDGFNPDDFTYDWITKEQYNNKLESYVAFSKSYYETIEQ